MTNIQSYTKQDNTISIKYAVHFKANTVQTLPANLTIALPEVIYTQSKTNSEDNML